MAKQKIDLSVSQGMIAEAKKGIKWREKYGRGGTRVGIVRARQIVNEKKLTPDTWKRMKSYLARHEVDKEGEGWQPGQKGFPSAGRIAWALWGGDPGKRRSEMIVRQLERED